MPQTGQAILRFVLGWSRGVTVSTLDSESSDRGSNPREAFLHCRDTSLQSARRLVAIQKVDQFGVDQEAPTGD